MKTRRLQEEKTQDGREEVAAKIIQRAWRGHVYRMVFKHIQMLISQCNQQDPQTLLRTVNPQEAQLLDSAAGVLIRFRLGGVTFPPRVYYKIFTYRPIVDLCASSPRDYNQLGRKKLLHQKGDEALNQTEERLGWYQRVENNTWRLFCSKVKSRDEPTEICTNKRIDFHPSKMKRREDVRKWKKRKKIEWLRQMYSEGRLQAHSDQAHLVTLARSSAQEVIETIEKKGDDEILDWELDELLAWTDSLNFEEYMEEWQHLACSYPSERSTGYPICTPILDLHDLGAAKL
ncbi:protein MFI isoform 2-T2 [Anableps anableps]